MKWKIECSKQNNYAKRDDAPKKMWQKKWILKTERCRSTLKNKNEKNNFPFPFSMGKCVFFSVAAVVAVHDLRTNAPSFRILFALSACSIHSRAFLFFIPRNYSQSICCVASFLFATFRRSFGIKCIWLGSVCAAISFISTFFCFLIILGRDISHVPLSFTLVQPHEMLALIVSVTECASAVKNTYSIIYLPASDKIINHSKFSQTKWIHHSFVFVLTFHPRSRSFHHPRLSFVLLKSEYVGNFPFDLNLFVFHCSYAFWANFILLRTLVSISMGLNLKRKVDKKTAKFATEAH